MHIESIESSPVGKPRRGRAGADRLLRLEQVKEIVGLGKTLIYRLVGTGEFPAPLKPGGSVARWSENEVNAWVAACAAQRVQ